MADETTPPAVTPGAGTSEFWLTKLLAFFGMAVTVLGTVSEVVQMLSVELAKVPSGTKGVGLYVAIVGALITVIPAALYKFGRVSLKKAALVQASNAPLSDIKGTLDAA